MGTPTFDEVATAFEQRHAADQQHLTDFTAEMKLSAEVDAKARARENLARLGGDLVRNTLDVPGQVLRGVAQGVAEIPRAFADLSEVGPKIQIGSGFDILNDSARAVTEVANKGIDAVSSEPRTVAGGLANGVGRFLSAFLPVSRALKVAEFASDLPRAANGIRNIIAGGAAMFATWSPGQTNLSALIEEHPALKNPVTEFLATDPADSNAVNRFKSSLEGAAMSVVIDPLLVGLKALRAHYALKAADATETAGRAAAADVKLPEPDNSVPPIDVPKPATVPPPAPVPRVTKIAPIDQITFGIDPNSGAARTEGVGRMNVTNDKGRIVGELEIATRGGDHIQVTSADIPDAANRGQGSAVRAYEKLVAQADERGMYVTSDTVVSEDAARVYASLKKKGYAVVENLNYESEVDSAGNNVRVSSDGKPLFEVRPNSEKVAAVTQAPTAQVSTALRATGQEGLTDFNKDTIDWATFGDNADDAFNVIESISRVYATEIDAAKGGVQPHHETARLAELVGGSVQDVAKLFSDVRGNGGIAARARAAEQVMLAAADRVRTLAKAVKADGGGRQELQIAINQAATIQAQVKGSKTEIARALNAMRMLKSATDDVDFSSMNHLDSELIKKLSNAKTLRELNELARRSAVGRWYDYANEIWINGLLTNPVTHTANLASNAVKAMAVPAERGVAAGIGALRRAAGQDVETVQAREMMATLHGLIQGSVDALKLPARTLAAAGGHVVRWDIQAARDLLTADYENFGSAYRAFAEGRSIIDGGPGKLENPGLLKRLQWDTTDLTGPRRVAVQFANLVGAVVRSPGNALQAGDELFKSIAYRQELYARATRAAAEEFSPEHAEAIYANLVANPPESLSRASIDFAHYQTFTNKLGAYGGAFQTFVNKVPIMRIVFPFVRTPINILKDFTRYTPLPLVQVVRKSFRDEIAKGGPEADIMLAKVALGTSAIAGVWDLAERGLVRGGGPAGPDTGELDNVGQYSIKLGDQWYGFNRLEPMGTLFGAVADLHDIVDKQYEANGDNAHIEDLFKLVLIATVKNATSKTWLSGLSSVADAAADPERYGDSYLRRLGASFVPFSAGMRDAVVATDPFARQVFTFSDQLRAGIPGLSEGLAVRRDYLGRAVTNDGKPWLSPIAVTHQSKDPVDLEMARLGFPVQMPDRHMDGVPLTATQYSRLLELRGTVGGQNNNLHSTLSALLSDPRYASLTDSIDPTIRKGSKASAIKDVVGKYSDAAKKQMLQEDPGLLQLWIDAKKRAVGAQ